MLKRVTLSVLFLLGILMLSPLLSCMVLNLNNIILTHRLKGTEVPLGLPQEGVPWITQSASLYRSQALFAILDDDLVKAQDCLMHIEGSSYDAAIEMREVFLKNQKPEQALTAAKLAASLKPSKGDALYYVADSYKDMGQDSLAESYYLQCIDASGFMDYNLLARCHFELGQLLVNKGQVQEAERHFENAQENPELYADLGKVYFRVYDDTKRALKMYSLATSYEPGNVWPYLGACQVLRLKGRYDEAVEWCQRGAEARPKSPLPYEYLSFIYTDQGDKPQTIQVLLDALELDPHRARTHYLLAKAYRANDEIDLVLESLEKAVRFDSQNVGYRLALANLLVSLNRKEKAYKQYKEVLDLDPDNQDAQEALHSLQAPEKP